MTEPRDAAFYVEAKLHGFRRTQEGVVVSFTVSPIDMPNKLATDPLGTRYQLALCELDEFEQPASPQRQPMVSAPGLSAGPAIKATAVEGRPAAAASPSAAPTPSGGVPSFDHGTLARKRAIMLCKDERFQQWIGAATEDAAADFMRKCCCDGDSRRQIARDAECYQRFLKLETEYRLAVGLIAEPR